MTTRPHSYFEAALTNSQPLRASAPPQAVAPVPAPSEYTAAAIDNLRAQFAALPDFEQHVGNMSTLGLRDRAVIDYMQNALAATPTGFDLATAQGIRQQGFETGRNTISDVDMARVLEQARNLATQLIATGASDRVIMQEIGNIPGVNAETLAAAQAAAQQVVDADKFNIFSTRNNDAGVNAPLATFAAVATTETANVLNPRAQDRNSNTPGPDFAELERRLRDSYRTHPGAIPGVPQLAFAAVESNGLSAESMLGDLAPTSGLPNLKGGPSRGGSEIA